MADIIFNRFFYNLGKKITDLSADPIKVALMDTTFTPVKTNSIWADVSAHEVAAGAGYAAGGFLLTGQAWTQDDVNMLGKFTANDALWTALTKTFRWAVFYFSSYASKDLIYALDFLANQSPAGVDFKIAINALGILALFQP
jgi:hypothetical protein